MARNIQPHLAVFQFTHPGGVRRALYWAQGQGLYEFQFTHPGGVRLVQIQHPEGWTRSFNSRTREGCDRRHLPFRQESTLFQFTHPGGVRPDRFQMDNDRLEFQFTHPGGVRQRGGHLLPDLQRVSIHAPGRGATMFALAKSIQSPKFQFTHPGGVRRRAMEEIRKQYKFQFTHPGGVRQQGARWLILGLIVSIHAPGRGATERWSAGAGRCGVSIHAPGRGATLRWLPP